MDSFFEKNGTMNQAMGVANSISSMKSNSSTERLGALSKLVELVMSIFV